MSFLACCLPVTRGRRRRDFAQGLVPRRVLEKFWAMSVDQAFGALKDRFRLIENGG